MRDWSRWATNGSGKHHSITLSAPIRNGSGTVRPCALAVLRVDHELELGRLFHRQIGGLDATQDFGDQPRH